MFSSARVSSTMVKASPSKMSMVAMRLPPAGSGSADEDARGEKRRMGGGDLALAGRAREHEVVPVDEGGAAHERDGRRVAGARIRLAPEHGRSGLRAVDGVGIVGGVFAR